MNFISKKIRFLVLFVLVISMHTTAQVGIGTTDPNTNAMLDIDVSSLSTKKGFMPPRMTTVEKNTLGIELASADEGMLVFDTDLTAFYYWNGTTWLLIRIDSVVTDSESLGNIYWTGGSTGTSNLTSAKKILGETTALNLVNFTSGGEDNRLVYDGSDTRKFTFVCSLSFNGLNNSNNDVYSFYVAKGSASIATAVLPSSRVDRYVSTGSDVGALSISGTVELSNGEWIEIWAENNNATNGLEINNFNLLIQSVQ